MPPVGKTGDTEGFKQLLVAEMTALGGLGLQSAFWVGGKRYLFHVKQHDRPVARTKLGVAGTT